MNVRTLIAIGLVGAALLAGVLFLTVGGDDDADAAPPTLAVAESPAPATDGPDPEESPHGDADAAAEGGEPAPAAGAGSGASTPPAGEAPAPDEPDAVTDADERAPPSPAPSGDPGTETILRATARAYEGLHAFRAQFEQVLENTLLGRTTRSQGTLFQRQPDRFLMRFSDPEGDLIVSDGEYFWMYFPSVDAKQVLRTPRGSQGLDLRAQFIGDPVRRFEATSHGTESVRGRKAHVLTLVPRQPAGYTRLKVWIDAEDHLVRRFELTEDSGNIRHFELRDLVANPSLPDDLFEFTPPPGAQVVTR